MKTTHLQLLHRLLLATVISVLYCVGCANIDDILKDIGEPSEGDSIIIAGMPIGEVKVLLAESDPVQVTVEINGWLPDSCTAHHQTHSARDGDTITIQITTTRPEGYACATVITEYHETVAFGPLPTGDYTVNVNGVEQEFRVD